MEKLPLKLHRYIVEQVESTTDLHALLFISRTFQAAAEQRIYRTLTFPSFRDLKSELFNLPIIMSSIFETASDVGDNLDLTMPLGHLMSEIWKEGPLRPGMERRWELLMQVVGNDRLTGYVVHLDLFNLPAGQLDRDDWNDFVFSGVSRLSSLKTLRMPRWDSDGYFVFPSPTALFRLHTFMYYDFPRDLVPEETAICEETAVEFLQSQTEIRQLHWHPSRRTALRLLPSTALPKLDILAATIKATRVLLPGRRIRTLHLFRSYGADSFPGDELPAFGSASIKHIILNEQDFRTFDLTPFSESFGSLEKIQIVVERAETFEKVLSWIPQMPQLRRLHIRTMWVPPYDTYPAYARLGEQIAGLEQLNDLLLESRELIMETCPRLERNTLTFDLAVPAELKGAEADRESVMSTMTETHQDNGQSVVIDITTSESATAGHHRLRLRRPFSSIPI